MEETVKEIVDKIESLLDRLEQMQATEKRLVDRVRKLEDKADWLRVYICILAAFAVLLPIYILVYVL